MADPSTRRWERNAIRRTLRGERAAFGEIYRAHAGPIFTRVLLPRLGDRAAAEDALSETFRTALERLDGYEDTGVGLYPWLARIAMNKATDMHRARARTGRALASFERMLKPLLPNPGPPSTPTDEAAPLEAIRGAITRVLERLNPRYRRAIELRFLESRARAECAEALDVKLGTFDVLLLRALRAFRKEWIAEVGEEALP